ncbi:shikimate dehydrogenase [Parashewanella spongiae]|uniref:Shikimate dehydrogenase (NADP(+)) n=1 Tax=Parashewanella spongiae TaxID=342950 RepID=A0A3A6U3L3_9GAMM|nr:shikimate dehydrogenase [Parashewanella spongiae]MCL1079290.1 shikimate dehydrogenase [Parashewanella spongiae]RJY10527.1 shikimate dehydrogenase [Parashewanella spongiae]
MSDSYVVIGNPIGHSQSPFIHHQFAQQLSHDIEYSKLLAPTNSFKASVEDFVKKGGRGANVTIPFKEQALEICQVLSEEARAAGAVNTITVSKDGTLKGDNTDGYGLVTDLRLNFGTLQDKRVLILGAGGATRGCLLPLLKEEVRAIVVANRTESKAVAIVNEFNHKKLFSSNFDDLAKEPEFDVIINATAASLNNDIPAIPSEVIHVDIHCYDMVYGSKPTAFLEWCRAKGANKVVDGLGMLVHQAAKSYEIWRNKKPNASDVLLKLRSKLRETQ